jgi:hypothetical protein
MMGTLLMNQVVFKFASVLAFLLLLPRQLVHHLLAVPLLFI